MAKRGKKSISHEPVTRLEKFWAAIAGKGSAPAPIDREEYYMAQTADRISGITPEVVTAGKWSYTIAGNYVDAWYYDDNATLTIDQSSGNVYRSEQLTLELPDAIKDMTPLCCVVNLGHATYPAWAADHGVGISGLEYYAVSGSIRNRTSHYVVSAIIKGRIS